MRISSCGNGIEATVKRPAKVSTEEKSPGDEFWSEFQLTPPTLNSAQKPSKSSQEYSHACRSNDLYLNLAFSGASPTFYWSEACKSVYQKFGASDTTDEWLLRGVASRTPPILLQLRCF
jgi:hypothetical protein